MGEVLEIKKTAPIRAAFFYSRQFHDAPGPWQSARDEAKSETTPKYLLYRPQARHQFWLIDVRYLVKIDEQWIYSLCIIEGYSRAILAGMASEHQDLTAVLQILYAALSGYGCPEVIVSDNAKVFYASDYLHILDTLAIERLCCMNSSDRRSAPTLLTICQFRR